MASPQDPNGQILLAVDRCLQQRLTRNTKVMFFFHRYASGRDTMGRRSLSLGEAINFTADLARHFDLPDFLFSTLPETFSSFDFTGSGRLSLEEVRVMVKKTLLEWRWSLAGPAKFDEFPARTLEDGGYTVVRELGRGGQGIMYLAKKEDNYSWLDYCSACGHNSGPSYCIKFYSKKNSNAGGLQEILEEFHRMREFDNVHVARTYEAFHDQDFFYLVNEPYFGGDLTKLAKRAYDKGIEMRESWWREIFRQCLQGLEYLHREAQMHCDIKEPNIMLRHDDFKNPEVVLIDFGLAQSICSKVTGISGTPGYIPPETWKRYRWQPQGDIFSLGVVFFQLLAARVPRPGPDAVAGIFQVQAKNVQEVGQQTITNQPPWQLFPTRMHLLTELVSSMLRKKPEERPRAMQALQHKWFFSSSDDEIPKDVLGALISGSAKAFFSSELRNELLECCNLDQLRRLSASLNEEAARRIFTRRVHVTAFRALLTDSGVRPEKVEDFIRVEQATDNFIEYEGLLRDAIQEKEECSLQVVTCLFNDMDLHRTGALPLVDIKEMLQSDAFEFDGHAAELLKRFRTQGGEVTLAEFQRVVLEDGRIAPKASADRGRRPRRREEWNCWWPSELLTAREDVEESSSESG
ncbi:CPK4 [Symbiodinium necroappetens]|uniref:CPK4 protein n=1 Tax=Symbiodinium necroappetens TaxID=1628268 RepID=A0A813AMR4_9DINO|nr:CPK4 [Symbiodinium necroappetens]